MRQSWRDMDSLLTWTRSDPHRQWWKNFLRDSGGTGFWHETYTMRGGMEAIYDNTGPSGDVAPKLGFMAFAPIVLAPAVPVHGSMFTAAHRSGLSGSKLGESKLGEPSPSENLEPVVSEKDLYDK